MHKDKEIRAMDLAHSYALTELVRFAIGEIAFDADRDKFRKKLSLIETAVISGLTSRKIYDEQQTNAYTEEFIRETASGYITRLLTSIRHPDDAPEEARQ